MDPERPRSNGYPLRRTAARAAVRTAPHVAPLNDWVAAEAGERRLHIPWFDPGDAGVAARVLFLLATPRRGDDAADGQALVSVDNDDPTSAALWALRHDAGLVEGCLLWNAVPWVVRGELTAADERRAEPMLRRLLLLLPELEVVVPMGRVAQRMWATYTLQRPNRLATLPTWLPTRAGLADAGRRADVTRAVRRAGLLVGAVEPARHRAPETAGPTEPSEPADPTAAAPAEVDEGDHAAFPRLRDALARIADRTLPS